MTRVAWTDEVILELHLCLEEAKNQGKKQIKGIEKMAEILGIKESAVYTKYYALIKRFGSLEKYLADKNLLNEQESSAGSDQSENENSEENKISVTHVDAEEWKATLEKMLDHQNSLNEYKARIRELEFNLKQKETIIVQKEGEIAQKDNLIKKLRKSNKQYVGDLETVKRILNRGKLEEFLSTDEHLFMSQEGEVPFSRTSYTIGSNNLVEQVR